MTDEPQRDLPNPKNLANGVFVGGNNEGIVNTGPNTQNVIFHTEGEFAYQIVPFPQDLTLSREPWHKQPSQLLLAQHQVVPFTGREGELTGLHEWLDDQTGPANALRLLHGPGGQGKTRLALKFAAEASRSWTAWQATTHTSQSSATAGKMTLGAIGKRVLIIVDYAERWSHDALLALVKDLVARPAERRRVLLVARSAGSWWGSLLHDLRNIGFSPNAVQLDSLSGGSTNERRQAYLAARDSFSEALGIPDSRVEEIPSDLDLSDERFGLMLTIHMAALVAVYARLGNPCPSRDEDGVNQFSSDPETFSTVLLDRERDYWAKLFAVQGEDGIDANTMAQAVYTATLTGRLSYANGQSALDRIGIESNKRLGSILKAHARPYPTGTDEMYLEPLYPDRLGEDFLALTTPGHQRPHTSSDPWTDGAIDRLLTEPAGSGGPAWTHHVLTVFIETAARWPHMANSQLYPFLRRQPQRMLEAGGTALAALASLPNVDFAALEAIERCSPDRNTDIDVGLAALSQRLGNHLLEQTNDPAKRAKIHLNICHRTYNANLHHQGVRHAQEAAHLYRELAAQDPSVYKESLARALDYLGIHLDMTGRPSEALAATQAATDIYRELVRGGRHDLEPTLGRVLANLAGRDQLDPQSRLAIAREAVAIGRHSAAKYPSNANLELAGALENLALAFEVVGDMDAAVVATREAAEIRRKQALRAPEVYKLDLLRVLYNLCRRLDAAHQPEEAFTTIEKVVKLYRGLAASDPASYEINLAKSLNKLGWIATQIGQKEQAIKAFTEAVELYRRPAAADPAHITGLAASLNNLGWIASQIDQKVQAIEAFAEAAELYRHPASILPVLYGGRLARSLYNWGWAAYVTGQRDAAIENLEEAATIFARIKDSDSFDQEIALAVSSFLHSIQK